MGINWLNMAQLGRTVTGLDWGRFTRAQLPAAMLAAVIGVAAMLAAEAARSAHLGKVPVVLVAALVAATTALAASRLRPQLFLGQHGTWATRQGTALLRGRAGRGAPAEADGLAPAGKAGAP